MRELKFKVWLPYNKMMMRPKDIIEITEARISNVTIGEMKEWIWLQFTGLHDKNGTEIYEGDIISNTSRKYKIGWNDFTGGFYRQTLIGSPGYSLNEEELIKDFEIIGNIYEHP